MRHVLTALAASILLGACGPSQQPTDSKAAQEASTERAGESAPAKVAPKSAPEARNGPFGLAMGMTVAEVKALVSLEKGPLEGTFHSDTAPLPHPEFETYSLWFSKESGLCRVVGIGVTFDTNSFGHSVRERYDRLKTSLSGKYGEPDLSADRVLYGSLWDDPDDFMMGLLQKEVLLQDFWGSEEKPVSDEIGSIHLEPIALSTSTAYLRLAYDFANIGHCTAEAAQERDKAL